VRKASKILAGKLEGKRPQGRTSHRWESNIKIDNVERGDVDWIRLVHDMGPGRTREHGNGIFDSKTRAKLLRSLSDC
jgi:hypothetical protein